MAETSAAAPGPPLRYSGLMRERIRRLPWKVEFVVVLGLAFGWTIPGTVHSFVTAAATARSQTPPITDIGVWHVVGLEAIVLALLGPFLRVRGWTLADLGLRPSLRGCLEGCGLALAAYVLYFGFAVFVASLWPAVAQALAATHLVGQRLSWTAILVGSIVNPFYEEILVCGYVISVLAQRRDRTACAPAKPIAPGEVEPARAAAENPASTLPVQAASLATAVNISAAIRLSYHLYQGVAGVLAVVPVGLLFGVWFARTRKLWPLIVAHAILDFLAFAAAK
jgi:CAAX protease family protein